jgi:hypothetical protein
MRLLLAIFVVASCSLALARQHESLEQLKARFESAAQKERVSLGLRIAEIQTDAADRLYGEGKSDEGRAAIADIVTYCEKASDAATQSGKKLKDAEITIRKITHKLGDIKRTVNFDDQAPLQEAVDHLERVRTQLLSKMFDLGKGAQ